MRASTIFALCLALLVGLAAAVVNRVVNQKAAPVAEAKAALEPWRAQAAPLLALADYITSRDR